VGASIGSMSSGAIAVPEREVPASTAEVRSAYIDQAVVGYLLYGVGAVTAFLAAALTLSDAEAALHSSVLAIGLLVAGFAGDRVDARIGLRRSNVLAYGLLATASVCLATAPAYVVTLAGAGMGVAVGLLLAHLNRALTRGGGALAQVRMSRAGLVAMFGSMSVPVVIGLGESSVLGWQVAFVVAGGLIVVGLWGTRWRKDLANAAVSRTEHLERGYWLTWWLLVLVVAVEFAFVFWASTLVERQLEVPLADATLVAASFYVGMAITRLALSVPAVGGRDPIVLVRVGLVVAFAGSLLAWIAGDVVLAAAGIFLGGTGVGCQYPLVASVALSLVPGLQDKGSARLILASGAAILVAPFLLGVAADAAGVSTAWLLIPATGAAALMLSVPVDRARS
jgi:MFS family permease